MAKQNQLASNGGGGASRLAGEPAGEGSGGSARRVVTPRTNIIKDKPAVARSIRATFNATRKVPDRDAKLIANKTVGKNPDSVKPLRSVAPKPTATVKTDKGQAKTYATFKGPNKIKVTNPKPLDKKTSNPVTVTRKEPKSLSQIKTEKSAAKDAATAARAAQMKTIAKRPVVKQPSVNANKNAADAQKLREDIKSSSRTKAAQDQQAYSSREANDKQAAREGDEAANSARNQWRDSNISPKTVQNPVNEKGTIATVKERAATGIKESNAADRAAAADQANARKIGVNKTITKLSKVIEKNSNQVGRAVVKNFDAVKNTSEKQRTVIKSRVLGGQHMGGHSDVAGGK